MQKTREQTPKGATHSKPSGSARRAEDRADDATRIAIVQITPRRALIFLAITTAVLTLLYLGIDVAANRWPESAGLKRLDRLFGLNGEANIPAWNSSTLWFVTAILAWMVAMFHKRTSREFVVHWLGFSAVCAFLSADEATMIHETIGDMIDKVFLKWNHLRVGGGWIYSWMYWGIGFLAAFLVIFRRFLLGLPRRVLLLLVTAGTIYTSGALGLEAVAASADHGKIAIDTRMGWSVLIAAEECLEMTGVVVLIYALLTYMRIHRMKTAVEAR